MAKKKLKCKRDDQKRILIPGDRQLTTGEVAAVCGTTERVVLNNTKSEKLPCTLLPGSRHRRFDPKAVKRWLKDHCQIDSVIVKEKADA